MLEFLYLAEIYESVDLLYFVIYLYNCFCAVGYQCSNFYRHLLQSGRVQDPNYTIDDKGKLHYAFGKGMCMRVRVQMRVRVRVLV